MSDNVTLPGTGALVAADELIDATLGTVKVQYVKIMDGTLDSSTKAGVGTGGLKVQASDSNGNILNSSGPGFLRVTDEPSQLFYDPFDGPLIDTVNRWSVLSGGGANPPSQLSGQVVIDGSGTSGGWTTLYAQNALTPTVPAWLGTSFALNLPDGAALVSTGYRFWGVANIPAAPSIGAPITDGVGFEVTGGKMYAVVYAAGVRTVIQDMSSATGNSSAPADANNHRYILYIRTDKTFWYIDSLTTPVATSSFQSPSIQTLPIRYLSISGGSSTVINSPGVAAWDTGRNSNQLSDGQFPWRKMTIKAANTASVASDMPLVAALHPSTPLPSGSNMIGFTIDQNLLTAKSADGPVYTTITGSPDGDFAGLNLLEQVIDDGSGLGFNTKITNLLRDQNGALIPSDMAGPFTGAMTTAVSNPTVLAPVSTTGYNSWSLFVYGGAGNISIQGSHDGSLWAGVLGYPSNGIPNALNGLAITLAGASFNGPVNYPLMRVVVTVYTSGQINAKFWLRTVQIPVVLTQPVSVASALTMLGSTAEASAAPNPVGIGGKIVTAATAALTAGNLYGLTLSSSRQLIIKPYSFAEADWQFTAAITVNTATAMIAAGAAGIRNYCTGFQFQNISATPTTITIQDGGTTIWQGQAPASMSVPANVTFPTPLKGTAATAMNVIMGTAVTSVLTNAQGYQSA